MKPDRPPGVYQSNIHVDQPESNETNTIIMDYKGVTEEMVQQMREEKFDWIAVNIYEGRELAIKDVFASDPYIRFAIVPCGIQEMPNDAFKSTYCSQTLSPEWNFSRITKWKEENCIDYLELYIEIWDYDMGRSDDFMGRCSIPLSTVQQKNPFWVTLCPRKKKEKVSGEIKIAIEIIRGVDRRSRMNSLCQHLVPLYHWKFSERMAYQFAVPRPEAFKLDYETKDWRKMICSSLGEERLSFPSYLLDAYTLLPPGSILGANIKLISLADGDIRDHFLRIYITGFQAKNNLLVGHRIYRDEMTMGDVYIRFYASRGSSCSKLYMIVLSERYLFAGPCMINMATDSLAMYIPSKDKYNYLPIASRNDHDASKFPIVDGKVSHWAKQLVNNEEAPIGEIFTPLVKLYTMDCDGNKQIPTEIEKPSGTIEISATKAE